MRHKSPPKRRFCRRITASRCSIASIKRRFYGELKSGLVIGSLKPRLLALPKVVVDLNSLRWRKKHRRTKKYEYCSGTRPFPKSEVPEGRMSQRTANRHCPDRFKS